MKKTIWKQMLVLIGLLISVSAFSQRKNLLMYHDPVTGRDTIISHVNFQYGNMREQQYQIRVRMADGKLREFLPHEISGYREGRISYYSRTVEVNGEARQVLLPRMYEVDSVFIYRFIQDNDKPKLYVQIGKDAPLIPFVDEENPARINPQLSAFLKSFPVSEESLVSKYLYAVKPTIGSFEKRHRVVRTGNHNYITRFRWGILAGASLSKADVELFDYTNKMTGFGGLFAEIPVYEDLSIRPEVAFMPYAYSSHQVINGGEKNGVYNRKDITGTFLFRYTLRSLSGKWLPFAQVGPEVNFALDKSMESASRMIDNEGFTILEKLEHPQEKGATFGLSAGVGVEYVLNTRHSLFFDVRYRQEMEEEGVKGICLTVSFNL